MTSKTQRWKKETVTIDKLTHTKNENAGCVHAKSKIVLANGVKIDAENLMPGMTVKSMTAKTGVANVTHVMKNVVDREIEMVQFPSGLKITPWHPVWNQETKHWQMPAMTGFKHVIVNATDSPAVYSFALDNGGCDIEVDGVHAITLAHGIENDMVATHKFFGTRAVLDALAAAAPSDNGVHILQAHSAVVDPATNLICGFSNRP